MSFKAFEKREKNSEILTRPDSLLPDRAGGMVLKIGWGIYFFLFVSRVSFCYCMIHMIRIYRYWTFEKKEKSSEMNATLTRPDSLLPDRPSGMV